MSLASISGSALPFFSICLRRSSLVFLNSSKPLMTSLTIFLRSAASPPPSLRWRAPMRRRSWRFIICIGNPLGQVVEKSLAARFASAAKSFASPPSSRRAGLGFEAAAGERLGVGNREPAYVPQEGLEISDRLDVRRGLRLADESFVVHAEQHGPDLVKIELADRPPRLAFLAAVDDVGGDIGDRHRVDRAGLHAFVQHLAAIGFEGDQAAFDGQAFVVLRHLGPDPDRQAIVVVAVLPRASWAACPSPSIPRASP